MGSLPNLHELGKENISIGYKPTTALGHLCGGYDLPENERNKIFHRSNLHKKVIKTRSCGNEPNKINNMDEATLEHMAGYSPISNRSVRNFHQIKRRESINSSIGATSVRRLLAVVRNNNGTLSNSKTKHRTTHFNKQRLICNLFVLCISNMVITVTYLPYLALQSSVSIWSAPSSSTNSFVNININIGSIFLGLAHLVASFSCLLLLPLNQLVGNKMLLCLSYTFFVGHYASTFYPVIYTMIPSSLMFGFALGLMVNAHTSTLVTIAIKLTNLHRISDEDEEIKNTRFTCLIRRTARAFRGAHDIALILGSLSNAFIIFLTFKNHKFTENNSYTNSTMEFANNSMEYDVVSFLDNIFDSTHEGTRLCGSQACPSNYQLVPNDTTTFIVPKLTTNALTGFYVILCVIAVLLVIIGMDSMKLYEVYGRKIEIMSCYRMIREAFRDFRLQLMAPLMFFIGLEQAFIYADFGKSYVVCTLGIDRLNFVYVAMGILQSIAACTLSMLLRSIRRYHIVGVGFTFHSCLMLVLILWKPMDDDPALFYVISAAWGVCNAIWEMLSFTLLTSQYVSDRCWESAFAVTAFYRFLGLSTAFIFHGYLCNYVKLYGLTFFMLVAVITFTYLDVKLENVKKLKNISRL